MTPCDCPLPPPHPYRARIHFHVIDDKDGIAWKGDIDFETGFSSEKFVERNMQPGMVISPPEGIVWYHEVWRVVGAEKTRVDVRGSVRNPINVKPFQPAPRHAPPDEEAFVYYVDAKPKPPIVCRVPVQEVSDDVIVMKHGGVVFRGTVVFSRETALAEWRTSLQRQIRSHENKARKLRKLLAHEDDAIATVDAKEDDNG